MRNKFNATMKTIRLLRKSKLLQFKHLNSNCFLRFVFFCLTGSFFIFRPAHSLFLDIHAFLTVWLTCPKIKLLKLLSFQSALIENKFPLTCFVQNVAWTVCSTPLFCSSSCSWSWWKNAPSLIYYRFFISYRDIMSYSWTSRFKILLF